MRRLARMLVLAVVAAFAAGVAVSAATSTTMSLRMAFAGGAATDMADCEGHPSAADKDHAGAACDFGCLGLSLALLRSDDTISALPGTSSLMPAELSDLPGRTAPPETHPPQALI